MRVGIVLARDGGALGKMLPVFQIFAGRAAVLCCCVRCMSAALVALTIGARGLSQQAAAYFFQMTHRPGLYWATV